jgi:hypothetical protein
VVCIRSAGQVAFAVGAAVIGEGNRLVGGAAQTISDGGDAIERVVGVGGDRAAGVRSGREVAGGVIGVGRRAGVRAGLGREISKSRIGVTGRKAAGVGHGRQVVVGVVPELREAAGRIGDLLQAVEFVVGVGGIARQRGGDRDLIAVVVIAEGRGDDGGAGGIDVLIELIERVNHSRVRAVKRTTGVVTVLGRAITHRIERIDDLISQRIGNLGQAVCPVVGVGEVTAVREGDSLQQSGGPVGEGGRFGTDLARG